jgi:hypothetical protein
MPPDRDLAAAPASAPPQPNRWGATLFALAPGPLPLDVAVRVAVAVGAPLLAGIAIGETVAGVIAAASAMLATMADIGETHRARLVTMAAATAAIVAGGAIGTMLGGTTYADEALVVAAAFVAAWVSASNPGIAAGARFAAIATATGAGLQFADPSIALAALAGGAFAILVTLVAWRLIRLPPDVNLMDWRAGLRRALAGADAGPWFAVCVAAAAALALFAAERLGVARPYWAAVTVMMVMRREGLESFKLVLHYMVGTLAGIAAAGAIGAAVAVPVALGVAATAFAASARLGFALNPALGFTGFTAFFMIAVDLALAASGASPHLLSARMYDVAVGCALAAAGTLAARAARRRRAA